MPHFLLSPLRRRTAKPRPACACQQLDGGLGPLLLELGDLAGRVLPEAAALVRELSAEVAELRKRAARSEHEAQLLAGLILGFDSPTTESE